MEGNQWYRPVLYLRWQDNEGGQLFALSPEASQKSGIPESFNHQNLNKIIKRLNSAKKQGKEGDISRKNGSFFEYNIHLSDVVIEFRDRPNIQKYEIKGKWFSSVYQEINVLGIRVDKPWGTNKKPNGNFSIEVELINETANQIKIKVDRYDDSANNYAANKVKELIESKIQDLGRDMLD
ncbi:MAG: hypothetical protein GDA56_18895 [Hormoscilla sp. GM7CHS1pb]|nr:hypothetical protein [Hormoscilla sp. GM7CHS1pb]